MGDLYLFSKIMDLKNQAKTGTFNNNTLRQCKWNGMIKKEVVVAQWMHVGSPFKRTLFSLTKPWKNFSCKTPDET